MQQQQMRILRIPFELKCKCAQQCIFNQNLIYVNSVSAQRAKVPALVPWWSKGQGEAHLYLLHYSQAFKFVFNLNLSWNVCLIYWQLMKYHQEKQPSRAEVPNLFTISYPLGTSYWQRIPLLPSRTTNLIKSYFIQKNNIH